MSTNLTKKIDNKFFMNLAFNQAKINLGNTKENPSVGCVITKNNSIVGAGFTGLNGRPHAEHYAIKNSRENLKNCNLYVTLEPCSNFGKTPPCVNEIVKNKFKKVYFSIKDPDLRSYNKSKKKLIKSKIKVNIGILSEKVNNFYKSYILFKKNELPFVTCKLALSKDFFAINKKKEWITNKYSRGRVHLMRSSHDSLITSSETIRIDNPILNCRVNGLEKRSPTIIILDNSLKISIKSNVIKNHSKYKTIIFHNKIIKNKIKFLKKIGIKTYKIPLNIDGNLDLKKALLKVQTLGFSRILVESGLKLSKSFLKENLVNDLKIFLSNKKLVKKGDGSFKKNFKYLVKTTGYKTEKVNLFNDKLLTFKIK